MVRSAQRQAGMEASLQPHTEHAPTTSEAGTEASFSTLTSAALLSRVPFCSRGLGAQSTRVRFAQQKWGGHQSPGPQNTSAAPGRAAEPEGAWQGRWPPGLAWRQLRSLHDMPVRRGRPQGMLGSGVRGCHTPREWSAEAGSNSRTSSCHLQGTPVEASQWVMEDWGEAGRMVETKLWERWAASSKGG